MPKQFILALLCMLLGVGAAEVYAAEPTAPDSMKAQFEMRQNIAWTVDGLLQLGNSKDRALKLTKAQARKILPIYQQLIAKKIIRLQLEKGKNGHPDFPGPNGGPRPNVIGDHKGGGPPDFQPQAQSGGDPQHFQDRMRERTALVTFGNAKMEAINRILTKKQVELIDNLDFDAEKYGFPNRDHFQNHPGGNNPGGAQYSGGHGQFGGTRHHNHPPGDEMRRPKYDQRQPMAMDPKFEAGRKRLVKLNQAVLKMLQTMK
jgi:hypothetical protein